MRPHTVRCQRHIVRDFADRAIRVDGHVEEDRSVAGNRVPVVLDMVTVAVGAHCGGLILISNPYSCSSIAAF